MSNSIKTIIDGASLLNIWAVIIAILPDITIVLSFIWILIRIYETRTFQHYFLKKPKQYTRQSDDHLIDEGD